MGLRPVANCPASDPIRPIQVPPRRANPRFRRAAAVICRVVRGKGTGMSETALYPVVKRFLETAGFVVKGEVCGCDILAVRQDEPPLVVIVELKCRFNLELLLQAVNRLRPADEVWLAVPLTRHGHDPRRRQQTELRPEPARQRAHKSSGIRRARPRGAACAKPRSALPSRARASPRAARPAAARLCH
jgi:hypothetical protein